MKRLPLITAWLLVVPALAASAQNRPRPFSGGAEAAGNFLYGAASQRVVTAAVNGRWAGRRLDLRLDASTGYGDARNRSTDTRSVIVRSSRVAATADFQPRARVSPFLLGSFETSLQQRIASRITSGGGVKYTIWRPPAPLPGFSEDLSLSAALLDERTSPLSAAGADTAGGTITRTRYSLRVRYRRQLSRQLRVTHVTYYQPTVNDGSRYTMDIATSLLVPVTTWLDLSVTHREKLDSEARRRGAASARDGQIVFGVRTGF